MAMIKIAAVTGPTASGKSALALALARLWNGEMISCDSMQIYKGMDIGTAKPSAQDRAAVPHHLIDIVSPDENFSCVEYRLLADRAIKDVANRGNLPVVCGGTGLYLDALLTQNDFPLTQPDNAFREESYAAPPEQLHATLREIDPAAADAIHYKNVKRVIRALEIFRATGITKTEWDNRSRTAKPIYNAAVIGLDFREKSMLYRRINDRVDEMMENGLLCEVQALDLKEGSTAAQAIGYKELIEHFKGGYTLDEAVEKIKTSTRNYAKRQLTWFRRKNYVEWIYIDDFGTFKEIVNYASGLLTKQWEYDIIS